MIWREINHLDKRPTNNQHRNSGSMSAINRKESQWSFSSQFFSVVDGLWNSNGRKIVRAAWPACKSANNSSSAVIDYDMRDISPAKFPNQPLVCLQSAGIAKRAILRQHSGHINARICSNILWNVPACSRFYRLICSLKGTIGYPKWPNDH